MSDRLGHAESVFHSVAAAEPERRESLLTELCAGDSELRLLVERLLSHDDAGMPGFLRLTSGETETSSLPDAPAKPHDWIGPYEILEEIGQGGMGTVYVARQHVPVVRDVALKLIRAGMDSTQVIARFEAERQALALMDHPNIARVLDAGETETGRPYFVMELIRGISITEYCDRHRLSTSDRLELFQPVCEAVQHAHRKTIIHRDLKPSNVIVTETDGRPTPKVIDFGVAKATAIRLTERSMFTEPGLLIGTLDYMSPEQADPGFLDVDTRSDVYSLGVILYELLVGVLPFDTEGPRRGVFEAIHRKIREEEPIRPSVRMTILDARSSESAKRRGTDVPTLHRHLRGDLDWIVMKALEKDRARRYGTPMELASDLQRHLRDEPVEAQPPSWAYRASKFIRRHRTGVGAAALVALALVAAVVGTSVGLVRARRAEALARTEQQRSDKAANFLSTTLALIDAAQMSRTLAVGLREKMHAARSAHTSTRLASSKKSEESLFEDVNLIDVVRPMVGDEILARAVRRIERDFQGDPALASDLYHSIGLVYKNLALYREAASCCERAVRLGDEGYGRGGKTTGQKRIWLAHVYRRLGRDREAAKLYQEAYETFRLRYGEDRRETLSAKAWLASCALSEGGLDEAERSLRDTLERMRRALGADDRSTLEAATSLGGVLRDEGKLGEAETLLRDTGLRLSRVLGPDFSSTLHAEAALASVIWVSGRTEEAERMTLGLLERSRRSSGDDSWMVLTLEKHLGELYLGAGRYDDAEPLLRRTAARMPDVLGPEHPDTRSAIAGLARLDSLRIRQRSTHPVR